MSPLLQSTAQSNDALEETFDNDLIHIQQTISTITDEEHEFVTITTELNDLIEELSPSTNEFTTTTEELSGLVEPAPA